jgi:hypothetical protein
MTAERGGKGIGVIRDDDRKSAGFFQYILSSRILISERMDPPFLNKFRFPPSIRMFFDRIRHYLCGSVSESGSGSFHHLAKILRKTLISTVL